MTLTDAKLEELLEAAQAKIDWPDVLVLDIPPRELKALVLALQERTGALRACQHYAESVPMGVDDQVDPFVGLIIDCVRTALGEEEERL